MTTENGPFRLPRGGRLIDRAYQLPFRFDGRHLRGLAGDTLASALLANDVRLMGRGFKYHRPRGVFTAGSEEPNALVELRSGNRQEPNTRATVAELFEGLDARSQNHVGPLSFDLLAVNDLMSPFFAAGFYYKTFMWPKAFWEKLYEPMIRRAAGLGSLSMQADPDSYDSGFLHCDLLVIGGDLGMGGAALLAADSALRAGAGRRGCRGVRRGAGGEGASAEQGQPAGDQGSAGQGGHGAFPPRAKRRGFYHCRPVTRRDGAVCLEDSMKIPRPGTVLKLSP